MAMLWDKYADTYLLRIWYLFAFAVLIIYYLGMCLNVSIRYYAHIISMLVDLSFAIFSILRKPYMRTRRAVIIF